MKTVIASILFLFSVFTIASGQADQNKWSWLIGTWTGEASGNPGKGSGRFSFSHDLDGKIVTRKSHTEFPSVAGKPKTVHDDMLIIYNDPTDKKDRAVYFDNEGHTIFYSVIYTSGEIALTSDKIPDSPVFRLVYSKISETAVNVRFEMSQAGGTFKTYIEGKSTKLTP